jgi:uncharacterized protein
MNGEENLDILLKSMSPRLNEGEYVFCCVDDAAHIDLSSVIGTFREQEGTTVILSRQRADELGLPYTYVSAWITLSVHSSLAAVGLTSAFSAALAKEGISCNVVAGVHHDHIFVGISDAERAMEALKILSS